VVRGAPPRSSGAWSSPQRSSTTRDVHATIWGAEIACAGATRRRATRSRLTRLPFLHRSRWIRRLPKVRPLRSCEATISTDRLGHRSFDHARTGLQSWEFRQKTLDATRRLGDLVRFAIDPVAGLTARSRPAPSPPAPSRRRHPGPTLSAGAASATSGVANVATSTVAASSGMASSASSAMRAETLALRSGVAHGALCRVGRRIHGLAALPLLEGQLPHRHESRPSEPAALRLRQRGTSPRRLGRRRDIGRKLGIGDQHRAAPLRVGALRIRRVASRARDMVRRCLRLRGNRRRHAPSDP